MSTAVQSFTREEVLVAKRRPSALLPWLLCFALLKILLQTALTLWSMHAGYGIYRDELYYLVCGHRLALGYVDQPPLVALQARLAEMLFGYQHLALFRLLPALAGGLTVALTGLMTQVLGGRRTGAVLAMLGVLTAPVFLSTQSFLSMNAWEPVFWMGAALALLHLLRGDSRSNRWWTLLGASAGLGLENKASMLFFLLALLLGLAATPARRLLATRGFLLAAAVATTLALPNFLWQVHNGFPTYEWLHDVAHSDKVAVLAPPQFLAAQVLMLSPLQLLLWLPGSLWLLRARAASRFRAAGWLYVFFLGIMLALHAKDYYVAPVYPLLFAAGGLAWERSRFRRGVRWYAVGLAASLAVIIPFAMPVLTPRQYFAFAHAMHIHPIESEQHRGAAYPEFFADHIGWQTLADDVARIYRTLPPAEQRRTGIFTGNYGQASAINILGAPLGLPAAISGHQNYWLWGPGGYTGEEMIVITSAPPEELRQTYRACAVADRQTNPYQMPWEQRSIYICRGRFRPYTATWAQDKVYR